jgi:AcrR family transcriptional regulator
MSTPNRQAPAGLQPPHVPGRRPGIAGGTRDKNRRARVKKLVQSSLKLFLRDGLQEVSVNDIAQKAGVGKGTFYHYFEDVEELVATMMHPLEAALSSAFDACRVDLESAGASGDLTTAYEKLARVLAMVFLSHPLEVQLYLQEGRGPAVGARRPIAQLVQTVREQAVSLTQVACDAGLFRAFDARVSAYAVVGASEQLLLESLTGTDFGDPGKVADSVVSMVLDGLRAQDK